MARSLPASPPIERRRVANLLKRSLDFKANQTIHMRINVLPTALGQKDTDHLIKLLQSLVEHRA